MPWPAYFLLGYGAAWLTVLVALLMAAWLSEPDPFTDRSEGER